MPLLEQEMSDRHEEVQQRTIPVHMDQAVMEEATQDSVATVVGSTEETTKATVDLTTNTTTAATLRLQVDTTVEEVSQVAWV